MGEKGCERRNRHSVTSRSIYIQNRVDHLRGEGERQRGREWRNREKKEQDNVTGFATLRIVGEKRYTTTIRNNNIQIHTHSLVKQENRKQDKITLLKPTNTQGFKSERNTQNQVLLLLHGMASRNRFACTFLLLTLCLFRFLPIRFSQAFESEQTLLGSSTRYKE